MAQDLAGVINQLRNNNEEERARDSNLNQNIAQSRRENTEALATLARNLSEQFVNVVRTTDQDQQQRESDREKDAARVAAGTKAWQTRQENLKKKEAGLASANEEKDNRMMRVFTKLGAGIKGLNDKFGSFAKSQYDALKKKIGGGIGAAMDIFKKFAMVGALAALLAFLDSEMFKNLKKDYIDPLTTSFTKLFTGIKNLGAGIDKIKSNFYDEEGNFDLVGGLTKSFEDIKNLLKDTGLALAVVGTLVFRKKLLAMAGSAASGMMRMLTNGTMFNDEVSKTNNKMNNRMDKAKKTGAFRKGFRGIAGRFGRLFSFFGRKRGLIGLMIGAGALMASKLDLEKTKGFLSDKAAGVGAKFKGMFKSVGDFGASMVKNAGDMGSKVTKEIGEGILSAKGALMTGFDNMFGALKNLGAGIKDLAGKAAAKVKSTLKTTGADIDPDAKAKADADAAKKRRAQMDKFRQADMQSRSNLIDFNEKKAQIEAEKKKAAQLEADKKKAQMDLFKKADADSVKAYKATQKAAQEAAEKAAKEVTEKTSKEAAEIIAKSATRTAIKKLPIVSIGAGLIFGFQRALEGDFIGAGAEVASGVAGTFPGLGTGASMGIDAGLLASDLGALDALKNNVKGSDTSADGNKITGSATSADGNGITPDPSRGGILMGPSIAINKGGDVVNGGDTNIGIVGIRDKMHGGYRFGY